MLGQYSLLGLQMQPKGLRSSRKIKNKIIVDIPYANEYFEITIGSPFHSIFNTPLFKRQANISQLHYLVHEERLKNYHDDGLFFTHKRSEHALLAACLATVILMRSGTPFDLLLRFVVAVAYHDAATPAGGDTVIRLNRARLCEELNFGQVMRRAEAERLFADFEFNISEAQAWVQGQGQFGKLLDIVDKLSYTLLDIHNAIENDLVPGIGSELCRNLLTVGEVWKDIDLVDGEIVFSSTERLYEFLMARARMHDKLYKNPKCRKLELVYSKEITDLLQSKVISYSSLSRRDDRWLRKIVDHPVLVEKAQQVEHRVFADKLVADEFCADVGTRLVYVECVQPFSSGLDFLTCQFGSLTSLRQCLSDNQIGQLEQIVNRYVGYHVYFYKE